MKLGTKPPAAVGIDPVGSSLVLVTASPIGLLALRSEPLWFTLIWLIGTPAELSLFIASSKGPLAKLGMYPLAAPFEFAVFFPFLTSPRKGASKTCFLYLDAWPKLFLKSPFEKTPAIFLSKPNISSNSFRLLSKSTSSSEPLSPSFGKIRVIIFSNTAPLNAPKAPLPPFSNSSTILAPLIWPIISMLGSIALVMLLTAALTPPSKLSVRTWSKWVKALNFLAASESSSSIVGLTPAAPPSKKSIFCLG